MEATEAAAELIGVGVNAGSTVLGISQMLANLAASSFIFMLHCFRDFVMMCLLLLLLVMEPKGMQLAAVFVGDVGCFPLAFRVGFGFGVDRMGALSRALITEVLEGALALL